MYKLLIVDDEPLIAENLFILFRDETDLELTVFCAQSGPEALAMMEDQRIDILLTDIVMPDMDGLALQAEVMARWPDVKVIFLTGLSDFAYAQAGQRMGGVDYVTKNEDDSAIVEAVQVAMAMLDSEIEKRQQLIFSRLNTRWIEPLRRSHYLERLINGQESVGEHCESRFADMGIPLRCAEPVLLMMMTIPLPPHQEVQTLFDIGELTENILARDAKITWFIHSHQTPTYIMQPCGGCDPVHWKALLQSAENVLVHLQKTIRSTMGAQASVSLCTEPISWAELPGQFMQQYSALVRASSDHEALLLESAFAEKKYAVERHDYEQLFQHLVHNDRRGFLSAFDTITAAGSGLAADQALQAEIGFQICAMFLSYINRTYPHAGRRGQLASLLTHIPEGRYSWSRTVYEYRRFAEYLFEERDEEISVGQDRLLAFVTQYALSHMDGDLSLGSMAAVMHFHPMYFSRLFKSAAGEPYSSYIAGLKLREAQRLLGDEGTRIADIAHMLGFENPSYFSRFFRRMTGMTPQTYRSAICTSENSV